VLRAEARFPESETETDHKQRKRFTSDRKLSVPNPTVYHTSDRCSVFDGSELVEVSHKHGDGETLGDTKEIFLIMRDSSRLRKIISLVL